MKAEKLELRGKLPTRCPAIYPDELTPSGLTRCADDEGHEGDHWHENATRHITWKALT